MKTHREIQLRIAQVNVKRAFGNLPLEAINKLTDRQLLSQKHIGISAFIFIRSMGKRANWRCGSAGKNGQGLKAQATQYAIGQPAPEKNE